MSTSTTKGEPKRRSLRPAPPRPGGRGPSDAWVGALAAAAATVPAAASLAAIATSAVLGWPSVVRAPIAFLTGRSWDPARAEFGSLPLWIGTASTSAIALLLAVPIGLGAALFLAELAPARARRFLDVSLDLVAAVPSVVWGLFALDALLPRLDALRARISGDEGSSTGGFGILAGGIVLAVMIVPTIAGISREVFRAVPPAYREAALALGATRLEVVRLAVLPSVRIGLAGAVLLGLGRALGEATAMAMVLGARADVPTGWSSAGYSAAALLLDQLGEATDGRQAAALGHLALALVVGSLVVQATARLLLDRALGARGRGP
jgi:phosphate transport system permease protein